jgi:hypothetical protein
LSFTFLRGLTLPVILKRVSVVRREQVSGEIPFVVMVGFCHEGDNIPDGIQMATWLNNWLNLVDPSTSSVPGRIEWVLPPSWSAILQPPPVDNTLFG